MQPVPILISRYVLNDSHWFSFLSSWSKREIRFFFLSKEFHWEESVKHIILSSFFWGYTITQIPASILTQRWTAQGLFSMTLVISGLLTVATPMAAHYGGWQMVIACRVMCGLVQGAVLPCLHTLLSRWSPPEERGRLCKCTCL